MGSLALVKLPAQALCPAVALYLLLTVGGVEHHRADAGVPPLITQQGMCSCRRGQRQIWRAGGLASQMRWVRADTASFAG